MAVSATDSPPPTPPRPRHRRPRARPTRRRRSERFLKLLVAQMQNQDPLSPMDNAQVTSQMAQINTVSGIEKLNLTVQGLSSQFAQLQAVQGASLVGHDVVVPGNTLQVADDGDGAGRLRADRRRRQRQGRDPRAERQGHRHPQPRRRRRPACTASTGWPARTPRRTGLRFRVTATSGSANTAATTLIRDQVAAVSTGQQRLQPRARQLRAPSLQLDQSLQLSRAARLPHKEHDMSFQQGLSGLNASAQEPGGHRQQRRQRQHVRRQVLARRVRRHVRQRAERRRRQQHRHRRHAGRGGAAVHAGQHHVDRQPDGPGASTAPASSS